MIEIKLTLGQTAIVCDCHDHLVLPYKWYAQYDKTTRSYYAVRSTYSGKRKTVLMHREILQAERGKQIDHINHDTLDNRCSNIRICTPSNNQCNRGKQKNNTSGYKGVFSNGNGNKWRARIKINGKMKVLGSYSSPEEAARAYDRAAIILHGDFAYQNFKSP